MRLNELTDPEYYEALVEATAPPETVHQLPLYGTEDPLAGLFPERAEPRKAPPQHRLLKYLRKEIMPTTFCVGCGGGTVLNAFTHAIDELGIDPREIVCVTGIGCSSWIPSPYFHCDTLHTTHGRAVAFAHGVKVMKPEMKVIIIAGDGDLAGIGGNHLIHAARRNIDLTVFLVNNFIYGMTGGQVSPTTPFGIRTTTTPHGNVEHPFKIAELVAAAGGVYVARWTTYHPFQLMESMQNAIRTRGFSFIEIMSQCPVSYGKNCGLSDAVAALHYFKDTSIHIDDARGMTEEELEDKIVIGKLASRKRSEFTEGLRRLFAVASDPRVGRPVPSIRTESASDRRLKACATIRTESASDRRLKTCATMRLRFSGFGGQGVVMCGFIVGKAAMLDGRASIHTQSYGSASRGGLTKSDVGIADGEIHDLVHDELDVLVAMSQQSYDAYRNDLLPEGLLFYDSDLVELTTNQGPRAYGIGATDIAFKKFGRKIMANVIMIGFVNEIAGIVSHDSLVRTIQESVPPGTEEKNIKALEEGRRLASEQLAR